VRLDGVVWEVSSREQSFAVWWVGQEDRIDRLPVQFTGFSFPAAERWGRERWAGEESGGVRDWSSVRGLVGLWAGILLLQNILN